jgi:hypothetical protein
MGAAPEGIQDSWAQARGQPGRLADCRLRWHDLQISTATRLAQNGATDVDLIDADLSLEDAAMTPG